MAKTATPGDRRPLPTSQGTYARSCKDNGAFDHMTWCKTDFYNFRPAPKVWFKGICAYAEGVGDVEVNMRDLSGQAVASLIKDVQYVESTQAPKYFAS